MLYSILKVNNVVWFMPLKKPLFLAVLNMNYSQKFTTIETNIKNRSEIMVKDLYWPCQMYSS